MTFYSRYRRQPSDTTKSIIIAIFIALMYATVSEMDYREEVRQVCEVQK